MISGIEKVKLSSQLNKIRAQIRDPSISGVMKIKLAKELKQVRAKITGKAASTSSQVVSRLSDLIAGKFDNLDPKKYMSLVREIFLQENAFDTIKQAVANYVQKNA